MNESPEKETVMKAGDNFDSYVERLIQSLALTNTEAAVAIGCMLLMIRGRYRDPVLRSRYFEIAFDSIEKTAEDFDAKSPPAVTD